MTPDRYLDYENALREAKGLGGLFADVSKEVAAVVAVADEERANDRLTLRNDQRYIARIDADFDALRAENARLRAELEEQRDRADFWARSFNASNNTSLERLDAIERVRAVLDDTERRGWATAMIQDIREALEETS